MMYSYIHSNQMSRSYLIKEYTLDSLIESVEDGIRVSDSVSSASDDFRHSYAYVAGYSHITMKNILASLKEFKSELK